MADLPGVYVEKRPGVTTTLTLNSDGSFIESVDRTGSSAMTARGKWEYRREDRSLLLEGAIYPAPDPLMPGTSSGDKMSGTWLLSVERRAGKTYFVDSPDEGFGFAKRQSF